MSFGISGINCEVIDVATLKPLDIKTIKQSVCKTGRCVIIHEAVRNGGVGTDIAAQVSEQAFSYLKAPPVRVAGFDIVVPYYRLEPHFNISTNKIVQSVTRLMESNFQ